MTRTPPLTQPNGYEKSSAVIFLRCTPTEHFTWCAVFGGKRKLPDVIRKLMNEASHKACFGKKAKH